MSERIHFTDGVGSLCGRGHPCNPKVTRIVAEVTCKGCMRKLGAMFGPLGHFFAALKEIVDAD